MTCSLSINGIYPPEASIEETLVRLSCTYVDHKGRKYMLSPSFTLKDVKHIFDQLEGSHISVALDQEVRKIAQIPGRMNGFFRSLPQSFGLGATNIPPKDPVLQGELLFWNSSFSEYNRFISDIFFPHSIYSPAPTPSPVTTPLPTPSPELSS